MGLTQFYVLSHGLLPIEIAFKNPQLFFHLTPGFTSLGKNALMSLNIEQEG